jgi:hypothetical protein
VLAVTCVAAPAYAQPSSDCLSSAGRQRNQNCTSAVERQSDRAEEDFWRNKYRNEGVPPFLPLQPPQGRGQLPWMPNPLGPTKQGPMTLEDLHLQRDGQGGFRGHRPGYRFAIAPDGAISFDDRPPVEMTAFFLIGLAGVFDLTDLVMRLQGADPYSYDKSKVIALTRGMRARMTDEERSKRMEGALARLPAELEALWRRKDLSSAERRAVLFQLGDELLEDADAARAEILTFITARLPAGSAEAYAPEELATFNQQRRSAREFQPYR